MKRFKSLLLVLLLCVGCTNNAIQVVEDVEEYATSQAFTAEEEFYINELYSWCIDVWGDIIPNDLKGDKVATLRYCDSVIDPYGDVLCEMNGYEEIEAILWPNNNSNN